jgi:hypothetical protein
VRQVVECSLGDLGVLPYTQHLLRDLVMSSLWGEAESELALSIALIAGRALVPFCPVAGIGDRVF